MRNFFFFILLAITCFTSCGKDDDDSPFGLNCFTDDLTEFSTASTEYTDAVIAFQNDPTEENCQLAKTKGQNYLDALEEWADCYDTFYPDEDYETELAEARQSIEDETCD